MFENIGSLRYLFSFKLNSLFIRRQAIYAFFKYQICCMTLIYKYKILKLAEKSFCNELAFNHYSFNEL